MEKMQTRQTSVETNFQRKISTSSFYTLCFILLSGTLLRLYLNTPRFLHRKDNFFAFLRIILLQQQTIRTGIA